MSNLSAESLHHAQILWDYLSIQHPPTRVDFLLVMGSHELRVAEHAADLLLQNVAPFAVISGGLGKETVGVLMQTEAETFANIMIKKGVDPIRLKLEKTATNSGENILKSRDLLRHEGLEVKTGIIVTKPYMTRRGYAVAAKRWPEISWQTSAPSFTLSDYNQIEQERNIHVLVGDLQRMKIYAEAPYNYQIPQDIPDNVWESYQWLVDHGYDRYVIKD